MSFLSNLKIKYKAQLATVFTVVLLGVFGISFLRINAVLNNDVKSTKELDTLAIESSAIISSPFIVAPTHTLSSPWTDFQRVFSKIAWIE